MTSINLSICGSKVTIRYRRVKTFETGTVATRQVLAMRLAVPDVVTDTITRRRDNITTVVESDKSFLSLENVHRNS